MDGVLTPVIITARDLPEAWFLCLSKLIEEGYRYTITRGSYVGAQRLEFDCVMVNIKNPGNRPIIPVLLPEGILVPTTMEYVESYLPYLMTSHKEEKEEYTYGQYLEPQIPKIIEMFKKGGFETNQAYMAVGDLNSVDQKDPPCLRGIQVRIRYGKMHFIVYFRSWDLWSGFPPNLAAIQLLKEYMVSELKESGVEDGQIIALSGGLHIYDYAWEWAEAYTGKKIKKD